MRDIFGNEHVTDKMCLNVLKSIFDVLKEIINSFLQKNYKNAYIKKSPYFKGYRGCGKLSDVLEFTSNATHMQQIY